MSPKTIIIETIGWYGTVAIVTAYALTVLAILSPESWLILTLNVTGALGIVLVSWRKRVLQPMVLNAIWLIIGIVAIVRFMV